MTMACWGVQDGDCTSFCLHRIQKKWRHRVPAEGRKMKTILKKKRIWLLLLIPVSVLILELAKRNIFFAEEIMAKRVYKVLSVAVSALTGWIPFSVAELIVVLAPVLFLVLLVRFILRFVKRKEERFSLSLLAILNLACTASVLFFIYVVGCGVNYYRVSIADYCEIQVHPSSKEELYDLCVELALQASELRAGLTEYEDEEGALKNPMTKRQLGRLVRNSYTTLAKEYAVLSGWYPAPKGIFFSRAFSAMEITGVFTCWTMESNVNIDIPDYSIASTMAHELGHLHGFMKEEEANFLACLACRASDSEFVRYSGLMLALVYCGNALAGQDMELYSELWGYYDEGIVRDFVANSAYWKQFEHTIISETADKVNDTYLKANHQEDGVKSYGRVVDLLLADYRARHGLEP